MSLLYILDGYNVLMRWKAQYVDSESIETGRQKLIQFLETQRPQGSPRNQIMVVFDGRSDVLGDWRQSPSGTIRVIFTEDISADEKIIQLVERQSQPTQVVVITDDRGLSQRIRQLGARVTSVQGFMVKKSGQKRGTEDKIQLEPEVAKRITEELTKYWLRKK